MIAQSKFRIEVTLPGLVRFLACFIDFTAYVAGIRAHELRWIAEGADVDKKFHAKYFTRATQTAE